MERPTSTSSGRAAPPAPGDRDHPAPAGAADRARSDAPELLVAATIELMGERRPEEITVRLLAARAEVQHSLITRHFGTRDALLGVAVARLLAELGERVGREPDLDAALSCAVEVVLATPALSRALPVLITQGDSPVEGPHPFVDALEQHLRQVGLDAERARQTAVALALAVFAWAAGESWWLSVAGHPGDTVAGRLLLERTLQALVEAGRRDADPAADG